MPGRCASLRARPGFASRAESSREQGLVRAHRHAPVDAFEQHGQLRRCERDAAGRCLRLYVAAALQPLGQQHQSLPVEPQHLQDVTALARKTKAWPQKGLATSAVCTMAAAPSKPFLMSVWPATIHTRVFEGRPITRWRPAGAARSARWPRRWHRAAAHALHPRRSRSRRLPGAVRLPCWPRLRAPSATSPATVVETHTRRGARTATLAGSEPEEVTSGPASAGPSFRQPGRLLPWSKMVQ